jgi:L-ascorbate 6-phosphate lactonase
MANKLDSITRESWILSTFPEWGTWLNEEIQDEKVEKNQVAMWWLGCTGLWIKTDQQTNILMDLWVKTGKRTKRVKEMEPHHQHARAAGVRALQPNLRVQPVVIDPFAIQQLDALLATHHHSDHIDENVAAAVLKNCPGVPFIGPKSCTDLWRGWGVPEDRLITVKPGDRVTIKEVEILALESFDRTVLVTAPKEMILKDQVVQNMDQLSVNYLIHTSAGNIYHAGDSHHSNYFAKHGNEHQVDVALGAFGENPRGMTDKLNAMDLLNMAENLKTKVVIPIHHDIWANFMANTNEILTLWNMRKTRLKYTFKPFIWEVGGKFTYPLDKDVIEYHHPRGFDDVFEHEDDLPFKSLL